MKKPLWIGVGLFLTAGVAAARLYYGKSIAEVTTVEAARLAAISEAPHRFADSPEMAKARWLYTLERMPYLGLISEEQARAAREEPIIFVGP